MNKKNFYQLLAIGGLLAIFGGLVAWITPNTQNSTTALDQGSVATLRDAYEKWRTGYESHGGGVTRLVLPLAWSTTLSSPKTSARGLFGLDLMAGDLSVKVSGLAKGSYDIWLIDNQDSPGHTVSQEAGDTQILLGSLTSREDHGVFSAKLDRANLPQSFKLDLVAITPAGQRPEQNALLVGAPGLMQQIYYSDKFWSLTHVGGLTAPSPPKAAYDFLLPKPAHAADTTQNLAALLSNQIAQGRQLFTKETFGGNGRTCATCHRLDNNYTIDPGYIAKLPKSDPLFVAETNPQLKDLENPKVLRQLGLILANVDGFERPGVLRSVPYTLGLPTSIDVEISKEHGGKGEFAQDEVFAHALGWSGDGSPGTGSLREFAIGAVMQHLPKTLSRVKNVDFRLPTDQELDALEAYMLSLGRSKDFDLGKLTFKSPVAERGKALFNTKENPCQSGKAQPCDPGDPIALGKTANCNGCHMNAGARSSTTFANPTRDTGVENMRDQPALLVDKTIPVDGGFGQGGHTPTDTNARSDCGPDHNKTCYGEGRFNTPALIEAADTAPYLHNHSVNTLEEAVASYNGDGFNFSPGAVTSSGRDRRIKLESTQVVAVAMFLRHLNVLENILVSNRLDAQAKAQDIRNGRETIKLAIADTEDAIEVVKEGRFQSPDGLLNKLEDALALQKSAQSASLTPVRNLLLQTAIQRKKTAKGLLVSCNPYGAGADTNPQHVYSCKELDQYELAGN